MNKIYLITILFSIFFTAHSQTLLYKESGIILSYKFNRVDNCKDDKENTYTKYELTVYLENYSENNINLLGSVAVSSEGAMYSGVSGGNCSLWCEGSARVTWNAGTIKAGETLTGRDYVCFISSENPTVYQWFVPSFSQIK